MFLFVFVTAGLSLVFIIVNSSGRKGQGSHEAVHVYLKGCLAQTPQFIIIIIITL